MHIAIAGSTGLVGRHLTGLAEAEGHRVTGLARSRGTDLVAGPPPDLTGVNVVVDVTQGEDHTIGATAFFEAVAATLATAARAAGVPRTVVLSILGVDRVGAEEGYFAAKLAHEQATRGDGTADVRVLRAAQFHDFPFQWVRWMARDGVVTVPDQPVQPVRLDDVVRCLLELATASDAPTVTELAGPRVERLPDLVRRAEPDVILDVIGTGPLVAAGGLLATADTRIAGPSFEEWSTGERLTSRG